MLRSLLAVTVLTACAASPSDPSSTGGGGKADGREPTITFTGDFQTETTGALLAGSPVRISYDLARVTDCRSDAWGVGGRKCIDFRVDAE